MDAGGSQRGVETWSSPAFIEAATAWIDQVLAGRGGERTGPAELTRLRHWGAIVRAPASEGTVWLKAPADATLFELGIYDVLAAAAPERILEPLAIDHERGWVLLPDGGEPIGEQLERPALVEAMEAAMPRYAELQIALMPRVGELLDAGVSDMRPEAMPARFDEAAAAVRAAFGERTTAGDREGLERIEARRAHYVELCGRLAGSPIPASLDHNDLHHMNVLLGPGGEAAEARFYDWGDSVVAHPFASLMLAGFVAGDEGAGAVARLRDAYLEPFSRWGSHAELIEAVELACNVGKVARSLTWRRAMSAVGPGDEVREHFRRAPLESLAGVLDDDWLGRA